MTFSSKDPESYSWHILPGRKVSHAIVGDGGICGCTSQYTERQLRKAGQQTRRCERCLITIVSGVCSMEYKFFVDHVPAEVRIAQRKPWKAYLAMQRRE